MRDVALAFTPHAPLGDYGGAGDGPLSGLTFAVKDLFDVKGLVTGAGTPAWAAVHPPAEWDAPVVARLRAAGARFVGKTITDELAWSLGGENVHYGAPLNVAAHGRVVGGSSSGSAAAVAAGLADFALGTDTGGSLRLPASYTGLWALRTTHGALPVAGTVPLAPSFDTVGWFTRNADTLGRVGTALLNRTKVRAFRRVLIAEDMFRRVDARHAADLRRRADGLAKIIGYPIQTMDLAEAHVDQWRDAFRVCQAAEAWVCHGDWIMRRQPVLGADVAARFAMAAKLTRDEIEIARRHRDAVVERIRDVLGDDTLLLVPGAPSSAPLRGRPADELAAVRAAALDLMCATSHAGVPQLALPGTGVDGLPLGLGLIADRGRDLDLLALGRQVECRATETGRAGDSEAG